MSSTTSEQVSLENSHWKYYCLNEEWKLHCAKSSFCVPGDVAAILFGVTTAGRSTYTFKWSDDKVILGTYSTSDPTSTSRLTMARGPMALSAIYTELLQFPDAFAQSSLELVALTVTVMKLQQIEEFERAGDATLSHRRPHGRPHSQTTIEPDLDSPKTVDIGDEYIQIHNPGYTQNIHPRQTWQPGNIIATLYGPAESVPFLQIQDPTNQVSLYEFQLTPDDTITVSARHPEVEAAWHELAERYQLHRSKGKDFKLVDVFCFLQTDLELPIPPEEVAALKDCVHSLATEAIERLKEPTFTIFRSRNPVLQCELRTLTLCLRREREEQSIVWIQNWFNGQHYAWIYGQMVQVMTTETHTVEISIVYERDGKRITPPPYEICHDIPELNNQGVYFCCEGLGYAGEILALPKGATPPPF